MDYFIREFSGRPIRPEDIETIKWVREAYPNLSLQEFAGTVCELLEWTTPAGNAKSVQCISCLKRLAAEGYVDIPESRFQHRMSAVGGAEPYHITDIDESSVTECVKIELNVVESIEAHQRWRAYVDRYHRLGCKQEFGSRLRYFILSGGRELGCIQYSASSWALEEREKWIGWDIGDRKARLHLIVNNSRFLIFPWVRVQSLASRILSVSARRLQADWLRYFCYAPVLIETFVDREFYKGVCYKAANYIWLGETKGRGRMDRYKERSLSRKLIFVYPLQRDFQAVLKGEKPCKEALQ